MKMTDDKLYTIGTKTRWGKIRGIGFFNNERFYFMVAKDETVAFLPHRVVRDSFLPQKSESNNPFTN